ncbi:hypothetical protein AAW06_03715 [Escherichia coli]|nr:hypothetical protein AAW06_03715 [Escherichia coli]
MAWGYIGKCYLKIRLILWFKPFLVISKIHALPKKLGNSTTLGKFLALSRGSNPTAAFLFTV